MIESAADAFHDVLFVSGAYRRYISTRELGAGGSAPLLWPAASIQNIVLTRFIDRVRVKGKTEPVGLYEFLDGDEPEHAELKLRSAADFQTAYQEYIRARFREAEALFTRIYRSNQKDKAAALYIERCRNYQLTGAPENWDGVEELTSK
ncbi:MAG: hypothetical protein A2W19_00845 [Spirochaetes bacterium RBG_16_49_21]|nr:MAG: hypothetical protein A2W19_00845 [Spirochaetes bacterium RBG_16_49_21]